MIGIISQLVATVSAGFAAWYWWKSARVEIPKELGVALWGDENNPFPETPEKKWASATSSANAKGAIWAAISFAAQFIGLLHGLVEKWGATP